MSKHQSAWEQLWCTTIFFSNKCKVSNLICSLRNCTYSFYKGVRACRVHRNPGEPAAVGKANGNKPLKYQSASKPSVVGFDRQILILCKLHISFAFLHVFKKCFTQLRNTLLISNFQRKCSGMYTLLTETVSGGEHQKPVLVAAAGTRHGKFIFHNTLCTKYICSAFKNK